MTKIAVTAASGQLGAAIVNATVELVGPENVVGLARTPSKAAALGVEIRPGDYTQPEQLEQSLLAGKIVAYAQGFEVLSEASREYQWNLPLSRIAEIWREGCLIRSVFLNDISEVFRQDADVENRRLLELDSDG